MSRRRRAGFQRSGVHASLTPTGTAVSISIEAWLARHSGWVLLILVAASVCVRSTYFLQLNSGPGIELHRWDQTDMHYYDAWGRQIASGDWLSKSVGVPMHGWHHRVAERYFADHPDVRAALTERATAQGGDAADPDALLWSRWTGSPQFYQDPLYPYLVGLTYRVIGDDVRFVFGWQMGLGVMSTVLIWLLARRFFGDLVAACAGALAVLCGPLVYYELFLLRESTIVFAGLGVVWLADRALTRGSWAWFVLLGVSLGLACLLKSSLVLLGGAVALGIVLHFAGRWRELWVPAAATLAGFAMAMAPLAARNMAVGAPPLALAGSGGLTFLISNDVTYDPEAGFDIDTPRLAELMGETGGGLLPAVRKLLGAHTFPSYARLLLKKWDRAWHWVEMPNNENFYYTRVRAPILAWLPVTFWLLAPAALVGLVLSAEAVLARMAPVHPCGVFRGTAACLLYVGTIPGRPHGRRDSFCGIRVRGAPSICRRSEISSRRGDGGFAPDRRELDGATPRRTGRSLPAHIGSGRSTPGTRPRLARRWRPTIRLGPLQRIWDSSSMSRSWRRWPRPETPGVVQVLAEMHAECATFLRAAGQSEQAMVQSEKARGLLQHLLRMNPANHEARLLLADTLFDEQSFQAAAVAYKEYLDARPDNPTAALRRGIALLGTEKRRRSGDRVPPCRDIGPPERAGTVVSDHHPAVPSRCRRGRGTRCQICRAGTERSRGPRPAGPRLGITGQAGRREGAIRKGSSNRSELRGRSRTFESHRPLRCVEGKEAMDRPECAGRTARRGAPGMNQAATPRS